MSRPQVIDDEQHEQVHERVAAIEVAKDSGHRSQLATSVYAKADQDALRPLARPWPGACR